MQSTRVSQRIDRRDDSWILWIVVAAIGVHIIEEYALDFPGWARVALGAPVTWQDFHLVNAGVIVYSVACAMVAWRLPAFSLSAASLVVLNALAFHLGSSAATGTYSPGTLSAIALFVPSGLLAYRAAWRDGVLTRAPLVWSILIGVLWHAFLGGAFAIRYFAPLYR